MWMKGKGKETGEQRDLKDASFNKGGKKRPLGECIEPCQKKEGARNTGRGTTRGVIGRGDQRIANKDGEKGKVGKFKKGKPLLGQGTVLRFLKTHPT